MQTSEAKEIKKAARDHPRPFFVIGVCTRGRGDSLRQLIDSIAAQAIPDKIRLEILIVDNNDEMQTVSTQFSDATDIPITVKHEPRRGLVNARNALFGAAQDIGADWILGIDDDEWLHPDWLVAWHRGTQRFPGSILVGTATLLHGDDLHPLHPRWEAPLPIEGGRPGVLTTANYAVPKDVFDEQNGLGLRFDLKFNDRGGEDAEFMLRAKRQHKIPVLGWPSARAFEMRGADRQSFQYEVWRGVRNQVNFYHVAQRHWELGISTYLQSPPITILATSNRNLLLGCGLMLFALLKYITFRKDAGTTLGRSIRRFARTGAVVPYLFGTIRNEYVN